MHSNVCVRLGPSAGVQIHSLLILFCIIEEGSNNHVKNDSQTTGPTVRILKFSI
jgi:hypothetical protein